MMSPPRAISPLQSYLMFGQISSVISISKGSVPPLEENRDDTSTIKRTNCNYLCFSSL